MNSDASSRKIATPFADKSDDLAHFVKNYLEYHGAYTENQHHIMEALLPEQLAKELGFEEHIRIGLSAQSDVSDNFQLSYGAPVLDCLLSHATHNAAVVYRQLAFHYLKSAGFERLVDETFTFPNAVFSIGQTAVTQMNYLIIACRYVAQSDELKEGLVYPVVNLETGASLTGLHHHLIAIETDPKAAQPPPLDEPMRRKVLRWVQPMIQNAVDEEIQSFIASMNRRYARDVKNLSEYYESFQQEMEQSLKRPGLSPESIQDRKGKIALIPAEAQRKKEDILKKYSIRIKVSPVASMRLSSPVVKVICRLSIGRQKKDLSLIYNPIWKALEPFVCSKCHQSGYEIHFNASLSPVCASCKNS